MCVISAASAAAAATTAADVAVVVWAARVANFTEKQAEWNLLGK